jgi:hypothetical protein
MELPNGLDCERRAKLSHSWRRFTALDLLVLFHQGKRTTKMALIASRRANAYSQLVKPAGREAGIQSLEVFVTFCFQTKSHATKPTETGRPEDT